MEVYKNIMINILMIGLVLIICIAFMIIMFGLIGFLVHDREVSEYKKYYKNHLTPTKKFILAASSCSIGDRYKCVIDIWNTHKSKQGIERVKELFEWGWGEFTYENVKQQIDRLVKAGSNIIFEKYSKNDISETELSSQYSSFQIKMLEKMKEQYPKVGMLAWDMQRILTIVGAAYMGGIMEYEEASELAFKVCIILQENFSSWDDYVGSYTLGYQFWRKRNKKDRLIYYKRLKRFSWIYKIPWNTKLKEEEL